MSGAIEIICGPMFSGKTEELIRRLKRASIAKQDIVVLKPVIDNRYSENSIVSHDSNSWKSIPIPKLLSTVDLGYLVNGVKVVGIDEVQFLDYNWVRILHNWRKLGKRIIITGLDMDFTGQPFRAVADILAIADKVDKLTAICECGENATRTFKKPGNSDMVIDVGGAEKYEARCNKCYENN